MSSGLAVNEKRFIIFAAYMFCQKTIYPKQLKSMFRIVLALLLTACVSITAQSQVTFISSGAQVMPGDSVEVDITVDDFINIVSIQYSINYDSLVMRYRRVKNKNNTVNVNIGDPRDPGVYEGQLTQTWNDPGFNPQTLPNGTRLYTLVFDVVGEECDSTFVRFTDDPLDIEILDPNLDEVPMEKSEGVVKIPGADCSGGGGEGFKLIASEETVSENGNVCVKISVEGFTDIENMQFSINYDPSVLMLDNDPFRNLNLEHLSQGSLNSPSAGEITVVWFDFNGEGVSVPDGTVIFEICFKAVGNDGQMTDISFTSNPLEIEVSDVDGDLEVTICDGKVTIGEVQDPLKFIFPEVEVMMGETLCVDVVVENFECVETMQFGIQFDASKFRFTGLGSVNNIRGFSGASINESPAGTLNVIWFDPNGEGVTLADGSVAFQLCFEAIGDCDMMSSIDLVAGGTPPLIEISTCNGDVDVDYMAGKMTITCDNCLPINIALSALQSVQCYGECTGSIRVTATGGDGVNYTYQWSGPNGPHPNSNSLTGLCAGDYFVTVTSCTEMMTRGPITVAEPDSIFLSINSLMHETSQCGDGAVSVQASGGTGQLTYLWLDDNSNSPDRTGLSGGMYTVRVTDQANCTNEFTITINGPGPLMIADALKQDITCADTCDGSVTLLITGGCEPRTVSWTGPNNFTSDQESISELCDGGEYSVTITDAKGAMVTSSFTIVKPDPIVITIISITPSDMGNNGAADISVSGGTVSGDYLYTWRNMNGLIVGMNQDISGLPPGLYTVCVIDDNGCEVCIEVPIGDSPITGTIETSNTQGGTNISCKEECDGTITITMSNGTEPYTYSWSDNGPNSPEREDLCAMTYSVTVEDADGNTWVSGDIVLTEPAEALTIVSIDSIRCARDGANASYEVVISGGTPPYAVTWCNGETGTTATGLAAGDCNVMVIDANGCPVFKTFPVCGDGPPRPCYEGRKVITPNGDGLNETFEITCIYDHPNTLLIFDRQGELVWEQDNYDNTWSGVDLNGDDVTEGGYLWALRVKPANGTERIIKGSVTVIRY